jgi:pimeloyl-ACP methyl ester carboxylesterase
MVTDMSTGQPISNDVAQDFVRGFAPCNGIEICYETLGDLNHPAVLLVMGLGAQLTAWDDDLCRALASRGRFVIRYDNRDCGLSTKFDGERGDLSAVMDAWKNGTEMPKVPYLLSDMAADGIALLDFLNIQSAHIVGASLGGMIVQTMAINHPDRVATLTSVMSTSGEKEFYTSGPGIRERLLMPTPPDRDGHIAASVETRSMYSSPKYFDPQKAAQIVGAAYDRSYYPVGILRQTIAIRASGSREEGLRALRVPTLVIHGRADTLIEMNGGLRTAELVDGANLLLLNDMGHDMPRPLWPLILDAVISHTS